MLLQRKQSGTCIFLSNVYMLYRQNNGDHMFVKTISMQGSLLDALAFPVCFIVYLKILVVQYLNHNLVLNYSTRHLDNLNNVPIIIRITIILNKLTHTEMYFY